MKLDLFTDSGIVLADRLSDGGLGRTVPDASFNDPPLLGREMRDVFNGIHEKNLPFPKALSGIQIISFCKTYFHACKTGFSCKTYFQMLTSVLEATFSLQNYLRKGTFD